MTFNTQSMLGEALDGQKKFEQAEPHLITAEKRLNQLARNPPASLRDDERLKVKRIHVRSIDRLVRHYKATGNKSEANRWQEIKRQELERL